jgi:hypothetical protein
MSTCMRDGERSRLHHALVDVVHRFASSALLHSRREACTFQSAPAARVDVLLLATHPPIPPPRYRALRRAPVPAPTLVLVPVPSPAPAAQFLATGPR